MFFHSIWENIIILHYRENFANFLSTFYTFKSLSQKLKNGRKKHSIDAICSFAFFSLRVIFTFYAKSWNVKILCNFLHFYRICMKCKKISYVHLPNFFSLWFIYLACIFYRLSGFVCSIFLYLLFWYLLLHSLYTL